MFKCFKSYLGLTFVPIKMINKHGTKKITLDLSTNRKGTNQIISVNLKSNVCTT